MVLTQMDEAFWNALEQSKLLTGEQLSQVKPLIAANGASSTPDVALRTLIDRKWLTPFQANRLRAGQTRGFFYDQYKVIDLLGLGGMGWIYQAVDTQTGQIVALKAMRQDIQHDQGMLARFQLEAKLGMRLHHPHILQTYTLGSAGGLPYLTMEYVAGPNLLELLIQRGRMAVEQACEMGRQMALALSYAHSRGVIHRDVKPQNVLIDAAGHSRLLDFGLSMFQEGDAGDEFSLAMIFGHESVGTLGFAAPEQVQDSLGADARADIYGLGATLYVALTGVNPWADRHRAGETSKPVPPMREYAPSIPLAVSEIVDKMLKVNPNERFASAEDVAEALSTWAQPGPVAFDYPAILAERKKGVEKRLAQLPSSQASASGWGRSTARPTAGSSVARTTRPHAADSWSDDPAISTEPLTGTTAISSLLRGPALRWVEEAPRASPAGMILQWHDSPVRIPLQQDRVLIGRSEICDLQINDRAVSGRHCEFQFDGRQWWLTDLESSNGTRVNGKEIKRQAVRFGDQIRIGNAHRFVLRNPQAAKDEPSTPPRQRSVWDWTVLTVVVIAAIAALVWGYLLRT